VFFLTWAN